MSNGSEKDLHDTNDNIVGIIDSLVLQRIVILSYDKVFGKYSNAILQVHLLTITCFMLKTWRNFNTDCSPSVIVNNVSIKKIGIG